MSKTRAQGPRAVCLLVAAASASAALAAASSTPQRDVAWQTAITLPPYNSVAGASALSLPLTFPDGRADVATLERFEVLAADAQIVHGDATGDQAVGRAPVALFRGTLAGQPASRVFLGLSPMGVNGLIWSAEQTMVISSGPLGSGNPPLLLNMSDMPEGAIAWREFVCHAEKFASELPRPRSGGSEAPEGPLCRIAQTAIETDHEFTAWLFGGNTTNAAAYVEMLIGAVSEVYSAEINTTFEIVFLRLWPQSDDPWNAGDTGSQLVQYQDYWNQNMGGVDRDAVHYLSGRGLGGGVAYFPGLCFPAYDYALSANLGGFFPYPLEDNNPQNWDFMVTAHEYGHMFNAPHTHDIGVDNCAGGDCSITPNGTIMSYCHLCPGGLANIKLTLHPTIINDWILPHLNFNTTCLDPAGVTISQQPASQTVCAGQAVTLTVAATTFNASLQYQWRKDAVNIPGATQSTLTIASAQSGDAGSYDVIVSHFCDAKTSSAATLTVTAKPGDLNGDCAVNQLDLNILLSCFLTSACGDLNGDGQTNQLDLNLLLANFNS